MSSTSFDSARKAGAHHPLSMRWKSVRDACSRYWAMYHATGKLLTPKRPSRPEIRPTKEQIDAVPASHRRMPYWHYKDRQAPASQRRASEKMTCDIMKENNMVIPSAAKSRRHK